MLQTSKRTAWIAAATSALGACFVTAILSASRTTTVITENAPGKSSQELVNAVEQVSADTYAKHVDAWRTRMRSIRSPKGLHGFVEELIGIEQKVQQGLELVSGESDEQRVLALFRRRIVDDRKLAAELQATVDGFDRFLIDQDRKFYEPAGLSREQWTERVHGTWRWTNDWSAAYSPVVELAVKESRQDAARFVVANVVADFVGNGIKKHARDAGWDKSKEGGVGDFLSGLAADAAVGMAIDKATDATDGIVARLSDEMVRAEHAVLDDKYGLFAELRRLQAVHQKARQALITNLSREKE